MKLNKNFIKHTIDGQTVVVPTADAEFHGLVQGNKTVGAILEYLDTGMSEEEIADAMCQRFDADESIIRADVADVISRLREIGAIDD